MYNWCHTPWDSILSFVIDIPLIEFSKIHILIVPKARWHTNKESKTDNILFSFIGIYIIMTHAQFFLPAQCPCAGKTLAHMPAESNEFIRIRSFYELSWWVLCGKMKFTSRVKKDRKWPTLARFTQNASFWINRSMFVFLCEYLPSQTTTTIKKTLEKWNTLFQIAFIIVYSPTKKYTYNEFFFHQKWQTFPFTCSMAQMLLFFSRLFSLPYFLAVIFFVRRFVFFLLLSCSFSNSLLSILQGIRERKVKHKKSTHEMLALNRTSIYVLFVSFSAYVFVWCCFFFRGAHWSACSYVMQFIAWIWNDTPHRHMHTECMCTWKCTGNVAVFIIAAKEIGQISGTFLHFGAVQELRWYSILIDFYFRTRKHGYRLSFFSEITF